MAAPRIAVFGIFGRTNLGNEATLHAFLSNVRNRFPHARIDCIGPGGSRVEENYAIGLTGMDPLPIRQYFWRLPRSTFTKLSWYAAELATEPIRSRRARRHIRDYDMLVIPGTGILDDFGQGPLDLPYHLLRWCKAARLAGVPVQFLSIGAEPVDASLTRRVLRRAADLATYRSYRDEESRHNAAGLGIATSTDPVYPDLAFSYPDADLPAFDAVRWPPKRVGIGVMGYYGWNRKGDAAEAIYRTYIAKIEKFVSWLLDHDHTVRLLIGDTSPDTRPVEDLAKTFGAVGDPRGDGPLIAEPIGSVDELMVQIADVDITIASRFHNVLLSLLMERPVISIGYSKKNDALLHAYGFQDCCQDIETFDVDRLIGQFRGLVGRSEAPTETLRRLKQTAQQRLDRQYEETFAHLQRGSAVVDRTAASPSLPR